MSVNRYSKQNQRQPNPAPSEFQGRKIAGTDVDVVCTLSQDFQGLKILKEGIYLMSENSAERSPQIVNINTPKQNSEKINAQFYQSQQQPQTIWNAQPQASRDNLRNRKNSSDSQKQGKVKSQSSHSRSANRSKNQVVNTSKQRTQAPKLGSNLNQQANKTLKRPNSAAILNQDPQKTNFKTMTTSPTTNHLSREPSQQQFLPPKPKGPLRNSTYAKLPEVLYQSMGSHPLAHASSNNNLFSSLTSSQVKRMPSLNSVERQKQALNLQANKRIIEFQQERQSEIEGKTFSPLRRKQVDTFQTNPSSSHKLGNSNLKGKSKQRQQNSSLKRKRSVNKVLDSVQTMSPNIERIRPQKIIQEENQEEDDPNQKQKTLTLDESEIKKLMNEKNKENEGIDSQNSSLSFKMQAKQLLKTQPFKDAEKELVKEFRQQLQLQNQNSHGEGQKKEKHEEKKQKIIKDNEQVRKVQIDLMRQEMNKRLEGAQKLQLGKKKKMSQQQIEQKEQDQLLKQKIEKKEQYLKEKEERQEIFEIIKDTMKVQSIPSQSNSQSRKREKSVQRPFSAKVPTNEVLLIKVPPVRTEMYNGLNPYDAVLTQSNSKDELLPFNEQQMHSNRGQDYSDQAKKDDHGQMNDFIQKQKLERSKKRKNIDSLEQFKEFKKQKALQQLQDKYKVNYEQFKLKQNQIIKTKLKGGKSKNKKIKQQEEYYAQSYIGGKKGRSKSKKRVDEEKENLQASVSPSRGRSGTRSDKKRKHKHQQSQDMTQTPSIGSIQRLTKNVYELLGRKDLGDKQYQKSMTLQNLHSEVARENIMIQKNNIKQVQDFQIVDAYKNYEMSFNQNNLQFQDPSQFKSQDFGTKFDDKKQSNEEQKIEPTQSQLTPVVISRKKQSNPMTQSSNSQVVIQGRPSEVIKSFEMASNQTTPLQKKQIVQDWVKQTQNRLEIYQSDPNFNQEQTQHQQISEVQNKQKSRVSSPHIKESSQANSVKNNKITQIQQNQDDDVHMGSPIRSPSQQLTKKQKSNEKSSQNNPNTKSSSKKKKKYKRNNVNKGNQIVQFQNTQVILDKDKNQQQEKKQNILTIQRPKSASIQKINMLELIQMQKKQQIENKLQEQKFRAAILIQRMLRGYGARKVVKSKKEQKLYEQNFLMIQEKYNFKTMEEQKTLQQDKKVSPIKILTDEIKQVVKEHQAPTQNGKEIVKQNVKQEENKYQSQSDISTSKNNINQSQLSRSQASLKALLAQEENKMNKKRPNSSDIINKKLIQQKQAQLQKKQAEDVPVTKDIISSSQKKVSEIFDYQTKLNKKTEQQNNQIKGEYNLDSASSQQLSNVLDDQKSSNIDISAKKIKSNSKNNLILKAQQNIRNKTQNLSEVKKGAYADIDSLSSVNKVSNKDIDEDKGFFAKYAQNEKDSFSVLEENKKDSFKDGLYNFEEDQTKFKPQSQKQQNVLSRVNLPGQKRRTDDGWSSAKKNEQETQNQFFQKITNASNHFNQANSQLMVPGQQFNLNTITSDDRDQSWQFDRKSFQNFYDQSSQVMSKHPKQTPKIENVQGSGGKQKLTLDRKLLQYQEMLVILEEKNEKDQNQLKKLMQKQHLSPKSLKKKLQLERWVTKQEEQLFNKKKFLNQNVNEIITNLDKDLQQTKKRIGTKKIGNNVFNNSAEWSHDVSLGQMNSSSLHSTPRVAKAQSILALNQIPQTERSQKRIPFEYKMIPSQKDDQSVVAFGIKSSQTLNSGKSSEAININEDNKSQSSALQSSNIDVQLVQEGEKQALPFLSSFKEQKPNIFDYNLAQDAQDQSIAIEVDEVLDERPSNINESLSKIDPPQFQSPTLSAISPNQNLRDYYGNDEEDKQNAPFIDTFERTTEGKIQPELIISTLSPEVNTFSDNSIKEEEEPIKPQPFINLNQQIQQENEELADAFMALKEPEQPISFKEAQNIREQKELREEQADDLTNYIMLLLLEQAKHNMYPKRAYISSHASPSKLDFDINNENSTLSDSKIQESLVIVGEQPQSEQQISLQNEKNSLKEKILAMKEKEEKKKKRLRGIKTTMRIVESYVTEVFKKVKDQEDEFVENLSTPLNKDPLEILLHLQNVCLDQEFDNAVAFQQSVLPVDLYLDIERNKQKVQILEQPQPDGSEFEENDNKSMMAEWENIHNKVIFDAINEALDNFRPYGLRGPPMPWSQQTRTLTYKNGQQIDQVLKNVRQKVIEWARTFSGALPCSELLQEYGIRGPLDEDKLNLLREERLALVLASEIEENEVLWTDYEYEETQSKLDIADMILEVLAEEAVQELARIKESRQKEGLQIEGGGEAKVQNEESNV